MSDHSRTMRMYTRTRRRYIKETSKTYSTAVGKTRPTAPVVLEDGVRVGKSEDLELKVPSVAESILHTTGAIHPNNTAVNTP